MTRRARTEITVKAVTRASLTDASIGTWMSLAGAYTAVMSPMVGITIASFQQTVCPSILETWVVVRSLSGTTGASRDRLFMKKSLL